MIVHLGYVVVSIFFYLRVEDTRSVKGTITTLVYQYYVFIQCFRRNKIYLILCLVFANIFLFSSQWFLIYIQWFFTTFGQKMIVLRPRNNEFHVWLEFCHGCVGVSYGLLSWFIQRFLMNKIALFLMTLVSIEHSICLLLV